MISCRAVVKNYASPLKYTKDSLWGTAELVLDPTRHIPREGYAQAVVQSKHLKLIPKLDMRLKALRLFR